MSAACSGAGRVAQPPRVDTLRATAGRATPAVETLRPWVHLHRVIYVLAYPEFEPTLAERLDAFRSQHEPHRASLVPPHLTFVFGVHDTHQETIAARVEHVSAQTHAFAVEFRTTEIEFDPFESRYKIFLQCGDGGEKITALHEQLYEGPHRAELSVEHPYRPHMTIATHEKRAAIERVDVSTLGELPVYGHVRALELVRVTGGKLNLIRSAPLAR